MANSLDSFLNHTVSIITSDGRNFVGLLKGFDQTINLILDDSIERVFSSSSGVEQVILGLQMIRGDNVRDIFGYIMAISKKRATSLQTLERSLYVKET